MLPRHVRFRWWQVFDLTLVLALVLFGAGIVLLVVETAPVAVTWETASEVGTAGFNVYRSADSPSNTDPTWHKINPTLLPARGDEFLGARYRYDDHDVQPGHRYQYRIEEVEWDAASTLYPDTVRVRAGFPRIWTRIQGAGLFGLALVLFWRKITYHRGAVPVPGSSAE